MRQLLQLHPFFPSIPILLPLVLVVGALVASAFRNGADDFIPLFEGNDLGGWVEMGEPGAFSISEGVLSLEHPTNYPNWLRSPETYENFILELEYQPVAWAEGGIYFHAPLHGDPARSGYKIHLRHDRADQGTRSTGALYDLLTPLRIANKAGDEWNALRIHMEWPELRVWMNDTLIHDVVLDTEPFRDRLRSGYIGFEDIGTPFRFRNARIKELPGSDGEWISLFNGRDLDGWVAEGEAIWEVRDGCLIGSGGDGVLATNQSFTGFEFRTYFKTTAHANGGIFYRMQDREGLSDHYEVQIYDVPTATHPTGSIYGIAPAIDAGCRSGQWCFMQVISNGAHSRVLINGRLVAEADDLELPDSGRIAIQNHSLGAIEYKGLRVQPLSN